MNASLSLAWRNIWRNRRRTILSMSAIGIGLLLVIFYSGLIGGMLGEAKNQLDNAGLGHVEAYAKDFRPKRTVSVVMPDEAQWASKLKLPPGSEWGTRVLSRGLATAPRGSEPIELWGVDWEREKLLTAHVRDVRQGALPAADDAHGVLVGEQLAERLQLKVGSKLRLMVVRADGEMGADLFRVRGVYHSIASAIGKRQVLVSQSAARELLGIDSGVHQLVVQLTDASQADALAASMQTALGPGFEVRSWATLFPVLVRMEALSNSVLYAVGFFVYLLVGLGVLNTMLMSVLERTREFGVLMALGTRPRRIVQLVLAESFWIATLSVVAGALIGALLTWHYSKTGINLYQGSSESISMEGINLSSTFKTRFRPSEVLKAGAFVYLMALIVGLYPASRISKLQPTEALRRT